MIALIQRVKKGRVSIEEKTVSEIKSGYVILLGIFKEDTEKEVGKLAEKIANLRIMSDENDKMNRSIIDVKGEILLVSQFTLTADLTFGRRPSFLDAMEPEKAKTLYELLVKLLGEKNIPVKTGRFGEYMQVEIQNDGPVTIIVDTAKF